MSQRFLRHSWLAIAAPFIALSIGRAADRNWKSSAALFLIGLATIGVEIFVVLRVRLRNPFYRLRNLKTDQLADAAELRRFQNTLSGYAAQIVHESLDFAQLLEQEEGQHAGPMPFIPAVGEARRFRQRVKSEEKDLCDLISDFRGFFYLPD